MMKGSISISRPIGFGIGNRIDYIQIELEDEASHTRFVTVRVKYADFAKAVTGLGVDCEFDFRPDHVGQRYEVKRELVFIPGTDFSREKREKAAKVAVGNAESDGWCGRVKDALNHHNFRKREDDGNWYEVTFTRFVAQEDPVPA